MATELKLLTFPENMKIQKYELQITNLLNLFVHVTTTPVMLFDTKKS